MSRVTRSVSSAVLLAASLLPGRALGAQDAFTLAEGGRAVPLLVSDADHIGVVRAVTDLRADVEGRAPAWSIACSSSTARRDRARPSLSRAELLGATHGLRYGVSLDDEAPQVVSVTADSSLRAWEQSVADNVTIGVTRHRLSRPGAHVLKFWLVDPGVVLQNLVLDAGGVRPSYLGPPESWRGGTTTVGRR